MTDSARAIALAHDYFTQRGGAERVAARLATIFPEAPMYTSVVTSGACPDCLARPGRLRTTPLQRLIDARLPLMALAPLLPAAFRALPVARDARVVLSSSSAFAQHIRVPAGAVHVAYVHSPPRFLWEPEEYFALRRAGTRVARVPLAAMRGADAAAARRVDVFLANSAFTADRIARFYGRPARVVPPPIETAAFRPTDEGTGRFLAVARLKRHKRLDLAVEAANRTGIGLDVIGEGPELARLRALAGPSVRFHGHRSDAAVRAAMSRAVGLLVPGVEDFGMTIAEMQAAGRPPIAFARGGALEIIDDGVTGFLVEEQSVEALADAMRRALTVPMEPEPLVASARRFDVAHFDAAVRATVAAALA